MTDDKQEPSAAPAGTRHDEVATVWKEEDIREVLRQVVDPELHMNIVDLGLVYRAEQQGDVVEVDATLTSPGCPYGPYILHGIKQAVLTLKDVRHAEVNVVWEPPWGPDRMTEEAKLELGFDL